MKAQLGRKRQMEAQVRRREPDPTQKHDARCVFVVPKGIWWSELWQVDWSARRVLVHNSTRCVKINYLHSVCRTYTILDNPSSPVSTLGGNRKSEREKICGGKSKLIISNRLETGLKRLESTSSWV
jgi:hypothetical protein